MIGEKGPIMTLNEKVHERGKYNDLQKVMIIGGGKTGFYLAKMLSEFGAAVKIIEKSKDRCRYLSSHLDNVMILHGDATDLNLLEEENLDLMDAVVTATGFDEDNLLLALTAKRHGIEDVIAKVSRASYGEIISSMGIDVALSPLDITTSNIIRYVQGTKKVLSSQLIQGQAEIIEIIASHHMKILNKPLKELHLPEGVIIAAIHRGPDVIIPHGDTKILEDDKVIMLSLLSDISSTETLLKDDGGKGFFKKLSDRGFYRGRHHESEFEFIFQNNRFDPGSNRTFYAAFFCCISDIRRNFRRKNFYHYYNRLIACRRFFNEDMQKKLYHIKSKGRVSSGFRLLVSFCSHRSDTFRCYRQYSQSVDAFFRILLRLFDHRRYDIKRNRSPS